MATLSDIQLAIAAQTTVEQGVVALLQQLGASLKAAIAAEDPAAVQGVLDMLTANTKALSDAVLANTPNAVASATLATPVPTPAKANPPPVTETTPADNVSDEPAPATGANLVTAPFETPAPPSNPATPAETPAGPAVPTAAPNTAA